MKRTFSSLLWLTSWVGCWCTGLFFFFFFLFFLLLLWLASSLLLRSPLPLGSRAASVMVSVSMFVWFVIFSSSFLFFHVYFVCFSFSSIFVLFVLQITWLNLFFFFFFFPYLLKRLWIQPSMKWKLLWWCFLVILLIIFFCELENCWGTLQIFIFYFYFFIFIFFFWNVTWDLRFPWNQKNTFL